MVISGRYWRPASALLAAAVAVLALAMPAGASTGTAQISPEQAGYTATGAQFKTIDARVFLRQPTQYASEVASFGHSVQLWSSGLVISVGLTASTSGGGYATYATVYDRSTHQVTRVEPECSALRRVWRLLRPGSRHLELPRGAGVDEDQLHPGGRPPAHDRDSEQRLYRQQRE